MKIVIVGDRVVSSQTMLEAVAELETENKPEVVTLTWETKDSDDFGKKAQNLEVNGPEAEEVPAALYDEIVDADMLFTHFCPVPMTLLEKAERLKLIATCRGGTEQIDIESASNMNIPVLNTIRNAEATSDFTIGMIYAEARNIGKGHKSLMEGIWENNFPNQNYTKHINEMTLGVVGLGNIGRLVARKANAVGMKVIGYDPFVAEEDLTGFEINRMHSIKDVFEKADVLSIHLRSTPETEKMIDAELIGAMKESAYLINTSRAQVVDKDALYDALENHRIGGAALDVFWEEPIDPSDPILTFDNVTITPHIAGSVVEALPRSPFMMVQNINDYLQKGQLNKAINSKKITSN